MHGISTVCEAQKQTKEWVRVHGMRNDLSFSLQCPQACQPILVNEPYCFMVTVSQTEDPKRMA